MTAVSARASVVNGLGSRLGHGKQSMAETRSNRNGDANVQIDLFAICLRFGTYCRVVRTALSHTGCCIVCFVFVRSLVTRLALLRLRGRSAPRTASLELPFFASRAKRFQTFLANVPPRSDSLQGAFDTLHFRVRGSDKHHLGFASVASA